MTTALAFQAFVPDQAERLTAYVRRLVPHKQPELQEVAADTAMALDAQCVGNFDLRGQVTGFLDQLEQDAQQKKGHRFVDLSGADQDELLKAYEGTALFQQLLHLTRFDFYNRHVVWETLGYPGLQRRLDGEGYLHKGFDQLEW
jgi:Gluconate 2-dehydrogenase subunit 3